ncbi:hypothetical protein LOC51_28770 [Rubrivivax sp. JA1024]|nr:hypothetical protein [Rubrivivax sp. JA1024]
MKRKAIAYFAPRATLFITVASLAIHSGWAWATNCGVNFQRGGAIVVLVAAALYALSEWYEAKGGRLDGGALERYHFLNPAFLLPFLAALGTLIWGYGDLLPFFGAAGCFPAS